MIRIRTRTPAHCLTCENFREIAAPAFDDRQGIYRCVIRPCPDCQEER
ncbi:hypothetical protein [Bailinhaonella thermotolerans]|nr:hypothetical protein [Bailinhaonella thermotolerans]